jgi:hypothetical protein
MITKNILKQSKLFQLSMTKTKRKPEYTGSFINNVKAKTGRELEDILREAQKLGLNCRQVAQRYGFNVHSIYKWTKVFNIMLVDVRHDTKLSVEEHYEPPITYLSHKWPTTNFSG